MALTQFNSILVIDDNYLVRKSFIKSKICTEDQIFFAKNGKEGIEFLQNYEQKRKKYGEKFPPVLVLLDINMPVMDGFEFLEAFKELSEDKKYQSIVVVMLTSSQNKEEKERASQYNPVKKFVCGQDGKKLCAGKSGRKPFLFQNCVTLIVTNCYLSSKAHSPSIGKHG